MKAAFKILLVLSLFVIVNSCKKSDSTTPATTSPRASAMADYDNLYVPSTVASAIWNGNTSNCDAGSIPPDVLAKALTRLNYFRKIVGLGSVSFNSTLNSESQQAALMMMCNSQLDHTPPSTWTCWSHAGAQAARTGNLAFYSGQLWTSSFDMWMGDDGVPELGHRRWIINSCAAASMGYGCTGTYASLYCDSIGAVPANLPSFVGWPGSGYIPVQFIPATWSFSIPNTNFMSSHTADFSSATVTMTDNNNAPVQILNASQRPFGYGDITFGWEPQNLISTSNATDYSYVVNINNVLVDGKTMNYKYTVTFFLAQ